MNRITTAFIVIILLSIISVIATKLLIKPKPAPKRELIVLEVSSSDKSTKLAAFSAIIGRAAACGAPIDEPLSRVNDWIYASYDRLERIVTEPMFSAAVKQNAENQKNGTSPDTCDSAISSFWLTAWPKYQHELKKVESAPEPPPDLKSLPVIDKEKGIDTTVNQNSGTIK